jgi:lipoprotein-anchoring transpeptidase ErfK/SrfK
MMKQLVLAAALFGIFSTAATADDRYATRPPVVLSPDLTAPWINQLGGGRVRPVVYQRPVVQPQQRGLFQRRISRRAPQVSPQTVSAINPGIPSIRRPIEPQYLPQMVDYDTTEKPGTIVIDTNNRFLYLVTGNGEARRYGVGVVKPGFEWAGEHKVTRKAEWPTWTPPS